MKLPKNLGFDLNDSTPIDPVSASDPSAKATKKAMNRPETTPKSNPSAGHKPMQRKAQGRRSA
jgi:hypothetical protein